MKKRDVWISVAIIAAAVLVLYTYFQGAGKVEIDAGDAVAVLRLHSNWLRYTTITSGTEPVSVGAGVHRPRRLSLSMEESGRTWRIDSQGPWMDLSKIRVKNLRTTAVRLGPPLTIKPTIRRNGPYVDINFAIVGQAGERYNKYVTKDNRTVRNAKVRIVDETGKILSTGAFRYG